MGIADPLLVDTNVLLEATDERRAHHADAIALIESLRRLVFPAQVVREYLAVATRPAAANGLGMPTEDALENVRQLRVHIRLLPEEKPILPAFLRLLETVPCVGRRVHDAHIVATALVHRIRTIVSLNQDDFTAFGDSVTVITPVEALRETPRRGRAPRRPGTIRSRH
ncbi:MAG: type II toxin-antitoxin system VapC family toxin [Candidatus Rokuibacteriota bacterium]